MGMCVEVRRAIFRRTFIDSSCVGERKYARGGLVGDAPFDSIRAIRCSEC